MALRHKLILTNFILFSIGHCSILLSYERKAAKLSAVFIGVAIVGPLKALFFTFGKKLQSFQTTKNSMNQFLHAKDSVLN